MAIHTPVATLARYGSAASHDTEYPGFSRTATQIRQIVEILALAKSGRDQEVREAAVQVNADEFLRQLEQGYQTLIGEGGSRLSAGQKQLVSLAMLNGSVVLSQPRAQPQGAFSTSGNR